MSRDSLDLGIKRGVRKPCYSTTLLFNHQKELDLDQHSSAVCQVIKMRMIIVFSFLLNLFEMSVVRLNLLVLTVLQLDTLTQLLLQALSLYPSTPAVPVSCGSLQKPVLILDWLILG